MVERVASQAEDTKKTQQKKSLLPIIIIIGMVVILLCGGLFGLTEWNKAQIRSINEKEASVKNSIQEIESKSEFVLYTKTKEFLSSLSVVRYAPYGSAVYQTVVAPAVVRSMQIQTDIEDNTEAHKAFLVLESYPPLSNTSSLLDMFKQSSLFSKVYVSSVSSSTNETGQALFSYPVTLTLSTRGNDAAQ